MNTDITAARDEHRHHRVGEAGVPGGGPELSLHQSRRQLLHARLPPPLHHLRRLRHRRLPLRGQAGDPRAVDGDGGPHRRFGRVHVRLPELRRAPHGVLPQRIRGRALQVQAVVGGGAISPRFATAKVLLYIFLSFYLIWCELHLVWAMQWSWLNNCCTLLQTSE